MTRIINKRVELSGGTGSTNWIILGTTGKGYPDELGVDVEVAGGDTVDVEVTLDPDLKDPTDTVAAGRIHIPTNMGGLTSSDLFLLDTPIKAIRLTKTAGSGTSAITVLVNQE